MKPILSGASFLWLSLAILSAQDQPVVPGRVIFFDDFDGPSLDATKWVPGLHVWGRNNRGVVAEKLLRWVKITEIRSAAPPGPGK